MRSNEIDNSDLDHRDVPDAHDLRMEFGKRPTRRCYVCNHRTSHYSDCPEDQS